MTKDLEGKTENLKWVETPRGNTYDRYFRYYQGTHPDYPGVKWYKRIEKVKIPNELQHSDISLLELYFHES